MRKDYTGYEKDTESGLQFAQARYYNTMHGRFTSVDPLTASASIKNPQTFNRYSYVLNSPYKYVDPLGLIHTSTGAHGGSLNDYGPKGRSGTVADCMECRSDFSNWIPDPGEAHEASHSNAGYQAGVVAATAALSVTSSSQQATTANHGGVRFTRISLLDVDGSVVRSVSLLCEGLPPCSSIYDAAAGLVEFNTLTDTGPEAIREAFTLRIQFEVADKKDYDGWEKSLNSVSVPASSRFKLTEVAGNSAIKWNTPDSDSKGSVEITIQSKDKHDEGKNMPIVVIVGTRYKEFSLYNINLQSRSGPEKKVTIKSTLRVQPVYGDRDGHPPRKVF